MTNTKTAEAGEQRTQGPWKVSSEAPAVYADGGTSRMIYTDTQRRYLVAEVYGKNKPTTDANATLIAAAPELLQFVKAFLDAERLNYDDFVEKYEYSADGMKYAARSLVAQAEKGAQ